MADNSLGRPLGLPCRSLFERILIPESVHRELQSDAAPDPIRRVLAEAPPWLEVRPSPEIDPTVRQLDSGEREVIVLGLSITRNVMCTPVSLQSPAPPGGCRAARDRLVARQLDPACGDPHSRPTPSLRRTLASPPCPKTDAQLNWTVCIEVGSHHLG
jgi:hypothetical protein